VQAMPSINFEKIGTKENYITEELINDEHKWRKRGIMLS